MTKGGGVERETHELQRWCSVWSLALVASPRTNTFFRSFLPPLALSGKVHRLDEERAKRSGSLESQQDVHLCSHDACFRPVFRMLARLKKLSTVSSR